MFETFKSFSTKQKFKTASDGGELLVALVAFIGAIIAFAGDFKSEPEQIAESAEETNNETVEDTCQEDEGD